MHATAVVVGMLLVLWLPTAGKRGWSSAATLPELSAVDCEESRVHSRHLRSAAAGLQHQRLTDFARIMALKTVQPFGVCSGYVWGSDAT